ncbi:MAG: hypothetical protein HFE73_02675 [Firmicutes bacterium]|nr:hypothetical protein [Bacillota bacterium]
MTIGSAYGATQKTIYAKQQTWLYSSGYETARYAVCPIGKNQKLKAEGLVRATMPDGKKNLYYKVSCFERFFYIPAAKVTVKPPAGSYTVNYTFKELLTDGEMEVYASPRLSGTKMRSRETSICTIGQMAEWYVVFMNGRLGYIPKDSPSIQTVKKTECIPIHISKELYPSADKRKAIQKRVELQYMQLPLYMRNGLTKRQTEVYITPALKEPFESMGSGGYTTSSAERATIYVKENDIYVLEFSLLHEIGHALTRYLLSDTKEMRDLMLEQKGLKLDPYYTSSVYEWIAEGVRLLVKSPGILKEKGPKTNQALKKLLIYQEDGG